MWEMLILAIELFISDNLSVANYRLLLYRKQMNKAGLIRCA